MRLIRLWKQRYCCVFWALACSMLAEAKWIRVARSSIPWKAGLAKYNRWEAYFPCSMLNAKREKLMFQFLKPYNLGTLYWFWISDVKWEAKNVWTSRHKKTKEEAMTSNTQPKCTEILKFRKLWAKTLRANKNPSYRIATLI